MAKTFNNGQFAGKQHHHGCRACRRRYVCACETPADDESCSVCRSGRVSDQAKAWEPKACCLEKPLKPITYAEDRKAYKLAGPGPWFKCPTCARTFPCQPNKVAIA